MFVRRASYFAAYSRGDQHHPPKRGGRFVRAMLLDEAQRDAEGDHDRNYDSDPLITQQIRCQRKRKQKEVERIAVGFATVILNWWLGREGITRPQLPRAWCAS